jgi:diguanylate cyclase (GGDEF)-like protein
MFAEPDLDIFFRQLVDSWQDGVLLVDENLTIRYCNIVFQNMIKGELTSPDLIFSEENLAGRTVNDVFNEPLAAQFVEPAKAVFKADDGHWLSDHLIISESQGIERHFSLQVRLLGTEKKCAAICLKNISALIRHEIRGNELELELEQNSLRDEVTGLSSRAYWESWLNSEFNRSKRYQQDLSIILIDLATHHESLPELPVEAFVNVLADVAQLIQGVLRNSDLAARYSEKRIATLLPHTNGAGTENLAARFKAKIDSYLEEKELQQWVEFRMGVAVFHGSAQNGSEQMIARYDDLLQLAEDDLLG